VSLAPGARLGPYEVGEPLGAGGMGEVFRARDTRLNRHVAIKVLPELFAADQDRLARFMREAQTLASLNHPNIAQIQGLEEGSVPALIMELVDGEDLSAILKRGATPVEDALPIARQIADALESAHEAGIIHRDLRPANINVRRDGTVKVLDFGLAKALEPAGGLTSDPRNSPTLTQRATQIGVILGTAAYMAPEQAKGRAVDRRADIWAFGVVLWEMLAGKPLFEAEDVSETLAAVLTREVSVTPLSPEIPGRIRTLVRDCLVRDPRHHVVYESGVPGDIWVLDTMNGIQQRVTSDPARDADPVWSPDGKTIAFRADREGGRHYARDFGVVAPERPLLKSDSRDSPAAWSRDGKYLAYGSRGGIWALPLAGDRTPISVAEPVTGASFEGMQISPDGRWIAYQSRELGTREVFIEAFPRPGAKRRVSRAGGTIPRWSRDGRELFYLSPSRELMAAKVTASGDTLNVSPPVVLFQLSVEGSEEGQHDTSSSGRFLVNVPEVHASSIPITVVLNWASRLKPGDQR